MNLGPAEILVILVIALLVFGPKRLPEVGRQVGGALRELRKVQSSVRSEIDQVLAEPPPATQATRDTNEVSAVNRREDDSDHPEGSPSVEPAAGDEPDGPSGSFI